MRIDRTQAGTIICNGIEYNDFPIPILLFKAMSREWASLLIDSGVLRIRHLDYFRNWENKILGDPNDGNGQYYINSYPMERGSVNDVYAWCMSFPEITLSRLAVIAEQSAYNCLVVIRNPEAMFQRIRAFLVTNRQGFCVHCGSVKYDRGMEVDKKTLNSQSFHYNVFQKTGFFQEDREYRLSITNCTFSRLQKKYLDLEIGSCGDIASIEELPDKTLNSNCLALLTPSTSG